MQQHISVGSRTATPIAIEDLGPCWPIYTAEFAADPWSAYRDMSERYGALVPVLLEPGLRATMVIDYGTAVCILNDPDRFSADPRGWQKKLGDTRYRLMPMLQWRPNALRTDGDQHTRYRTTTNDALKINRYRLRELVEHVAAELVGRFCAAGSAELLGEYCTPLTLRVITTILGCTPEQAQTLGTATTALFDSADDDIDRVNQDLNDAFLDLVTFKRACPGDDIATRLVQHPANLTDEELVHQLLTIVTAALEGPANLIANTLVLWLTDKQRFLVGDAGLPPSTTAMMQEALIRRPPMAIYCLTYPRHPIRVGTVWLPPDEPVVVSLAACNFSPVVHNGAFVDNRSHLSFGAGPHACPGHARILTELIVVDAVDALLDALPEMVLGVGPEDLLWRPGPLHSAPAELPVVFPATDPVHLPGRVATALSPNHSR